MERIGIDQSTWDRFVSGSETDIQKNIKAAQTHLEICNVDFAENLQYLHRLGYGQVQFRGCHFPGNFSIEHGADWTLPAKVLDFIDCKFHKIAILGNNTNASFTFHNFSALDELEVEGQIKYLKINNEINDSTKLIDKISLNSKPGDVHSTIELLRVDCKLVELESVHRTRISFEEAVINKLKWGGAQFASVFSVKSKFEQTIFEGFSGQLLYEDSILGKLQVSGGGASIDEEYDFLFKNTTAGHVEFICDLFLRRIMIGSGSHFGTLAFGELHAREINVTHSMIGWLVFPIKTIVVDTFDLSGSDSRKLHVNRLSFLKGTFEQQPGNKAKPKIILENFTLSALDFVSFHNNSYVYVSDVRYAEVEELAFLSDFSSTLSPEFVQICLDRNILIPISDDEKANFRLVRSDLGKINFISCDFSRMTMLFVASKMNEIFLAGTELPANLTGRYAERQIGYAQLKKVNDNRGDSVRSNEYLALELEAHYESLSERKQTIADHFDKITLFANKYSNRFNQSWISTLGVGLPVMALLYACYCISLGFSIDISFEEQSMLNLNKLLALFPEFIYPIHGADYVAKAMNIDVNEIPAKARLMEFLCRAVNGYFFYQFIQAFRKFGKK